VLHLGQEGAVTAVRQATRDANWVVVELWSTRAIAEARIVERDTGDVVARLTAWDETERLATADLRIDTGEVSPREAAAKILRFLEARDAG
jgi:guanylate kinase